ncbi:MAG: OsmC family protein [Flavobacteriaceae bacterium]|nr:OsmC family protein [Bacteroidia bacterium]NNL15830.1 OsmC family protein [Flavobacteriaceae bacterium]
MNNIVTTEWQRDMVFESNNPSGDIIKIDSNEEFGGTNSGLRPKALMLSSLAGCSGLDVVSLLKKMKVNIDDFKIITTGELTEEHPKYYNKVKIDYHFYGNDLHEKKINKAVNLSIEKYCGVFEMFRHFAKMETEIHLHKK